ncbi:MAG: urease accessory protein UreE [Alphaproteobacteria bacterium]|nr:urease accessory protein UreE [Alphaproteobacteria bacterium]
MVRGIAVISSLPATAADDMIVLDYEDRHRRRYAMTTRNGLDFLLDLAHPVRMREGDMIKLENGCFVRVVSAPEELTEFRPARSASLALIAYHLGNRHVEAQLFDNRIRIRRDHVLEDMVRGLGGDVRHVTAPFDPLPGAYEKSHADAHLHAALIS